MPKSAWTVKRQLLIVGAVTLVIIAAGLAAERRFSASGTTELWFFDVGQGDAALIRSADGRTILIDGGPDDGVLEGLASAMPWGSRRIDVLIATHLDTDHFVGFFGVLRKYDIGEIWWTGVAPNTATARKFVDEARMLGIKERFVSRGDRYDLGDGRSYEVLWPAVVEKGLIVPKTADNSKGGGTNDHGIVGVFDCGEDRAFYAADVSAHVEARLVSDGISLEAALLKLPHHGSRHSSSESFLDAVHPREAVISVGSRNRYGHPTARVLASLLERGIRIHRTDRDGTARYICERGVIRKDSARRWWKL